MALQQDCVNVLGAFGQTPLMLASKNGLLNVVKYLIEEAKVDVNERGNLWTNDSCCPVNGTALHAAVIAGELDVVNYLLECDPNINATTKQVSKCNIDGGSTALHLAVKHLSGNVQDEIIICLLTHGAGWVIADDKCNNNQCLELMNLLVNLDGDLSLQTFNRIKALELIGATVISSGNLENGFYFLRAAMELRFHIAYGYIPKPPLMLSKEALIAFKDACEIQTMKELEGVAAHDPTSLHIQAHLIRIRILGLEHKETIRCLTSYAFSIWCEDPQAFLNYVKLILEGVESTETSLWFDYCQKLIALSLIAIVWCTEDDAPGDKASTFNNVMPILRKLVCLLRNASMSNPFTIDFILVTIVNLAHIVLHYGKPLTDEESCELKCWLHQAVRLRKWDSNGFELLLIACSAFEFSVGDLGIYATEEQNCVQFQRYVSSKLLSVFLEVGANVDSVSNEGDTSLHVLAKTMCSQTDLSSFQMLYDAGVYLDQKNAQGLTMNDILHLREL